MRCCATRSWILCVFWPDNCCHYASCNVAVGLETCKWPRRALFSGLISLFLSLILRLLLRTPVPVGFLGCLTRWLPGLSSLCSLYLLTQHHMTGNSSWNTVVSWLKVIEMVRLGLVPCTPAPTPPCLWPMSILYCLRLYEHSEFSRCFVWYGYKALFFKLYFLIIVSPSSSSTSFVLSSFNSFCLQFV